jgi:adenosylcobinamide kinase/adenosylcobinamide-phosphate guanylyltransferase
MKKITLILGGIRSGKSHFAEKKALFYSDKPVYIATSIPFDEETIYRIKIHKKRRKLKFKLIEEPYDLAKVLNNLSRQTVIIDCLTLNLSNRLLLKKENLNLENLIKDDEIYLNKIYKIINKNELNIIFVSNEVGCAPVETNKLGRYFQELQGRWNRIIAGYANEVYNVQAGITRTIKKEDIFPFKISAPSYLLPTGYIENVTYLMNKVDDIQLLLFDSMSDDPLFKDSTINTLNYLAEESNITYSIHMQVRPKIFEDYEKRLDITLFTIGKLIKLNISSFIFHYDLPDNVKWENLKEKEVKEIDEKYIRFLQTIKNNFKKINISLENTETPLSALDRVILKCDITYCIDIGHLLFQKRDLSEIESRLIKTQVLHIHGIEKKGNKFCDHKAITYNRDIFKIIEKFKGILTIENYHPTLFEKSLQVLQEYF